MSIPPRTEPSTEMPTQETRFVFYPPRLGCKEVQRLKERFKELGHHCFIAKRIGEYSPRKGDLVIGWGYSRKPVWAQKAHDQDVLWLNHHDLILNSVRKLRSFEMLQDYGVPIPKWTTSRIKALSWGAANAIVLARATEDGCKGSGITVVQPGQEMPEAMFYTLFIPSTREYRVYVIRGAVVDILEKRRITDHGQVNEFIRGSEETGWCFCRQGVHLPQEAKEIAIEAVNALGLDFGGVDILCSGNKTIVLEVNTAPDVFGSGLDRFIESFVQIAKGA